MISIADVTARPFDIELNEPFGIATGAQHVANNVLVTITLSDGTIGLGEAAPFPAVNGETQSAVLAALSEARTGLLHHEAQRFRPFSALLREALPDVPTARAACESACSMHFANVESSRFGRSSAARSRCCKATSRSRRARRSKPTQLRDARSAPAFAR